MLADFQQSEVTVRDDEVVVVGSGAVGMTLAVTLARRGANVTVLEAGGASASEHSQSFFASASASGVGLPGLRHGRFRALGGTTNFWGGQLVPLDSHILAARPWVDIDAWPLTEGELAPYHDATFRLLGMAGMPGDDAVWRALKVAPPPSAHGVVPFFTRWAPVPNFVRLFGDEIRARDNLRIYVNAPVASIAVGAGGRVAGVEVAGARGVRRIVRGAEVVIAAGTIETVRLLLLPVSGGGAAPWRGNPWLGRGFMDHLDCFAGSVRLRDRKRFSELFDNAILGGMKYNPKLRLDPAIQARDHLLDVSGFFIFRSDFAGDVENLKTFARGLLQGRLNRDALRHPLRTLAALRFAPPMVARYLRQRRVYNFSDAGIFLRLNAEQSPVAASRISLRTDTDSLGMPNVDVAWRIADGDMETMAAFAERVRDYLAALGIADLVIDPRLAARSPDFMAAIDDGYHQMGGARMGRDEASGVVDRDLRVFGVENLHVAGAVVYPSSGCANPTFTAMALGQRLADTLLAQRPGSAR